MCEISLFVDKRDGIYILDISRERKHKGGEKWLDKFTITAKSDKLLAGYSDSQWKKDFKILKDSIKPSSSDKLNVTPECYSLSGEYHGKTQYQYYRDMINDILNNIRHGETDYCYYIYQVAELLKYEHDRLCADWLPNDRCFKLYIKR